MEPLQRHAVRVTRQDLAEWFDESPEGRYKTSYQGYEPGEQGGRFRWGDEKGARAYEGLRGKTIVFLRHCESTYQTEQFSQPVGLPLQMDQRYKDAELTEKGKVQAAALGARLAVGGFVPDLVVSSPLTRCLETAALVFPTAFLPAAVAAAPPPPKLKVLSKLLPEIVHSWGDTGRSLAAVIDGEKGRRDPKPHLEAFRGAESGSRFQNVDCISKGRPRPRRWVEEKEVTEALGEGGKPREGRGNAKLRCALVWRWLSENRPEQRIAIVTHSKLIKTGEKVHLVGPGIEKIKNGEFVHVTFDHGGV